MFATTSWNVNDLNRVHGELLANLLHVVINSIGFTQTTSSSTQEAENCLYQSFGYIKKKDLLLKYVFLSF